MMEKTRSGSRQSVFIHTTSKFLATKGSIYSHATLFFLFFVQRLALRRHVMEGGASGAGRPDAPANGDMPWPARAA
jgi:hypothetical protein